MEVTPEFLKQQIDAVFEDIRPDAVEKAKAYISGALSDMLNLGQGSGPMNHAFDLQGQFLN